MNIQIEHREDHTARLTVEVDGDRFDAAKKTAAGALSERVNIPGFRRGKAPYRILANYIGEAAILEEAVEQLSQSVYRDALLESKLDPYGPGALEDAKTEGAAPVFVYNIPLQPVVELGDYRAVRLPYEAPVVTDEQMNTLIKNLQRENAVVETSNRPLALGDRATVDLHAFFVDAGMGGGVEQESDEARDEASADIEVDSQAAAPAPADPHDAIVSGDREVYAHQHDAQLFLDGDDEPLPGFNQAMVGAVVGEQRTFELTIPDADPPRSSPARTSC